MRKQLLLALCAAGLVLGVQAQNSASGPSGPGSSTAGSPGSSTSGSSSQFSHQQYSATGRMGQQEVRASKLMGSEIKSSSGETLGTVSDVILNPSSGKVDFAVISLSSTLGSTGKDSNSSTGTASASSQSTSSAGKLAAVPWSLLRSSASTGYGASASSSSSGSGEQQSFVFTGEKSKLESPCRKPQARIS
jgi:sporulation protein YlmC with PRC-barrel domain